MYWVIDDLKTNQREAFICDEDELNNLSYDGYYSVATFDTYAEAAEFCNSWNDGADPHFMNVTINDTAIKDVDGDTVELTDGTSYFT